jgi:DNA-binding SARP family transcriptional activator
MEATVVAGVESAVESEQARQRSAGTVLQIRMLGPLSIRREGRTVQLPPSRKLRGLIAYLTLAPQAPSRERLCELLWDLPNDPRGELRGCLSKARAVLDEPGHRRVETVGDAVRLNLTGCHVDVLDIGLAMGQRVETLETERLRGMLGSFAGDFLQGLEIERSPLFSNWLTAQRRRLRAYHAAVLEQLVARIPGGSDEFFACLDAWIQLAPFDRQAHGLVLQALGRAGRLKEGGEHLAATARAFEAEGLDWHPLRSLWRSVKASTQETERVALMAQPVSAAAATIQPYEARRASIAVMPFTDRVHGGDARGGVADGLAHDIITRLAKLRSLFVIAQGTVFALDQRSIGPEEAGRSLNVDYVVSGTLLRAESRITVNVELIEPRTARIVWADVFDHKRDDAFLALEEIGSQIVASIESEIDGAERNKAILKPPNSLDAWEAHHRGLWHMYRFNRHDNEQSRQFFEMALRLDPTFSRAYAGLSFTHWQNAFQRWGEPEAESVRAFEAAGLSLSIDDRDPAAHWAMGRALWLRGEHGQSLLELRSAVHLSPNFALGHYALGFVDCQSGDAEAAIGSSDYSRHLSPYDPLLFGMLAVRAIALVRLGRFDEAAEWAQRAAARPNAHVHIQALAAECLAMTGRHTEVADIVARIRRTVPGYGIADFLGAFQLSEDTEALFRDEAKRIGLG